MFSRSDSKPHRRKDSGQFYFVPREPGVTSVVRDKGDEGDVIELNTDHAKDETYEPKPVNRSLSLVKQGQRQSGSAREESQRSTGSATARPPPPTDGKPNPLSRTLFAIFGGNKQPIKIDETGAKKVDPKLFFALERTFLAWMLAAIWVSGISIGIGSRSKHEGAPAPGDGMEALCSLLFLGIAIAFILYALVMYAKRSLMIVRRSPGPYDDKWGPVVIGSLFVFSLTAQYCIFWASYYHRAT